MASFNKITFLVCASVALAVVISTSQIKAGLFDPLVSTGVSELSPEGRHVGVNLPGMFNLNLDTRGGHNGVKMAQSVLSGLVRVNMDRQRGPDGRNSGPIKVTVGGMTVYDNQQSPIPSS